jgi:hypothetical protein
MGTRRPCTSGALARRLGVRAFLFRHSGAEGDWRTEAEDLFTGQKTVFATEGEWALWGENLYRQHYPAQCRPDKVELSPEYSQEEAA